MGAGSTGLLLASCLLQQIGEVVSPLFDCGEASCVFLFSTVFCVVAFGQAVVACVCATVQSEGNE